MKWVLDTSALFALQEIPEGDSYIPPGVLRELREHGDNRVAYLPEVISVTEPSRESLNKVDKAAIETGDDARISPVDRDVLALAMDMGATLVTDDYSLQNLASHVGIAFAPVGKGGITRKLRWKYKCTGCGRIWSENHPDCPVCGSHLRSFRSRK
jgi:UPF0271 protein